MVAIIGLCLPLIAFAEPNGWKVIIRDNDDANDIIVGTPTHATSGPQLLGIRINADDSASWYNFSNMFSVGAQAGTYGNSNYTIGFNTGNIHLFDLADADDIITGLMAGKVGTTTYSTEVSSLQSQITSLSTMGGQVQADWNQASTTIASYILNKPSLAPVATSGAYASLTGRPSLATVATSGSYIDLSNKPALGISYEGTTQRTSSFPIFKSVTVASGVAVFNLTSDGTAGGTALFPNAVIQDSVNVSVSDATASYQMGWAFTNSNKTLTVTTNKLTTANILTGILGQATGNGSVVKLTVWGY